MTGQPVELLWVKGSGGDLGTLTENGLAVLRLDRMRALVDVYPGVEREDEMVAAFDYCLHGKGGAAPRSTPRCTAWSTPRTWTISIPTRASRSPPPPTARSSRERSSATGSSGCRGAARASSWGWTSRRSRRRTRRPSARSSADTASPPGAIPPRRRRRTPSGSSTPPPPTSRSTGPRTVRRHALGLRGPAGAGAPRAGGRPRRNHPRARVDGQADGRSLHRQRRGPRLPRLREGPGPRRPRHELP